MSTKCANKRSVSVCETWIWLSDPRERRREYCMKSGSESSSARDQRVSLDRTSAAPRVHPASAKAESISEMRSLSSGMDSMRPSGMRTVP